MSLCYVDQYFCLLLNLEGSPKSKRFRLEVEVANYRPESAPGDLQIVCHSASAPTVIFFHHACLPQDFQCADRRLMRQTQAMIPSYGISLSGSFHLVRNGKDGEARFPLMRRTCRDSSGLHGTGGYEVALVVGVIEVQI